MADRPGGSLAVTVTVAEPTATPTTVTWLPDADAVATPGLSDDAVYVSASPSGSRKYPDTSSVTILPASRL